MRTRNRLKRILLGALLLASVSGCAFAAIGSINTQPGGTTTGAVQYRRGNSTFGGESAFRYDDTSNTLFVDKIRVSSVVFSADGSTQTAAGSGGSSAPTSGSPYYIHNDTLLQQATSYVLQARVKNKLIIDSYQLWSQYDERLVDFGAINSSFIMGRNAAPNITENASNAMFIGEYSGYNVSSPIDVLAIGPYSGFSLSDVDSISTFIGPYAGAYVTTGQGNTLIGFGAGYDPNGGAKLTTGHANTVIGWNAAYGIAGAAYGNTFIGTNTGAKTAQYGQAWSGRTAIGYGAKSGADGATAISGEDIYYKVGIGTDTPTAKLHVKGDGTGTNLVRFQGLDCTGAANGGKLTTDSSGNVGCADDVSGGTGGFVSPATSNLDMSNYSLINVSSNSWVRTIINGTSVYWNAPVPSSTQTYIPLLNGTTVEWRATLTNIEQYTSSHTVSGWRVWNSTITANAAATFNAAVTFNGATTFAAAETHSAAATFNSAATFNGVTTASSMTVTYGVSVGSATVNDLTASRLVMSDSNKKLASVTIDASLDLTGSTLSVAKSSATLLGPTITLDEVGGGDAGANTYDFGDATAVELPNGSNPTVTTTGRFAVDTSSGQVVISTNGANVVVLSGDLQESMTIPTPAQGNFPFFFRPKNDITVDSLVCISSAATSTTIQVQECDANGANCTTINTAVACATTNTTATLTDTSVTAGNRLRVLVTAVSGTPGYAALDLYFRETRK